MSQLEAIYRMSSGQMDYTPAGAVTAGEIVQLGDGRAAIVKTDLAAGVKGSVYTEGIFDIKAATGTTWDIGAPVYWDASASLAITSPGAVEDLYLGTAVIAKASGPREVLIDLNKGSSGSGSVAQRGMFQCVPIALVHDDATEQDILLAAENPSGMIVHAFYGLIDVAPVGSSEDQLILSLLDEDDNVLSTITTTDTTPDAAGDIVQGLLTVMTASTGDVMAVIPAGKAAKVAVTQPTVGGSINGEVTVFLTLTPRL